MGSTWPALISADTLFPCTLKALSKLGAVVARLIELGEKAPSF